MENLDTHNPDAACVCCALNIKTYEMVSELTEILALFNPENLKDLPGPLGMMLRQLIK